MSDLSCAGGVRAEVIPEESVYKSLCVLRSQGLRQAGCSRARGVRMSGEWAMLWVLGQEAWDGLWTTSAPEGGSRGMCWQSYGEKPGQSSAVAAEREGDPGKRPFNV